MILSNVDIVNELKAGSFSIDCLLQSLDPSFAPFNTSAVDLRLGSEVRIPKATGPVTLDLTKGEIAKFLASNTESIKLRNDHPFKLQPNKFVLANTMEKVNFPITGSRCFSARVEGKSSLARCGILVHFTAPTIHAGFKGTITLEMINLGPFDFLLTPGMSICQLIIEEVYGQPSTAPNQFSGQVDVVGKVSQEPAMALN